MLEYFFLGGHPVVLTNICRRHSFQLKPIPVQIPRIVCFQNHPKARSRRRDGGNFNITRQSADGLAPKLDPVAERKQIESFLKLEGFDTDHNSGLFVRGVYHPLTG